MPTQDAGPICQFVYTGGVPPISNNYSASGFFNYINSTSGNPTVWSYIPTATATPSLKPTTSSSVSSTTSSTASSSVAPTNLSGNPRKLKSLSTGAKTAIGVAIPLIVFFIVLVLFFYLWQKKGSKLPDSRDAGRGYEKPELEARERYPDVVVRQEVAELSSASHVPQELEGTPALAAK